MAKDALLQVRMDSDTKEKVEALYVRMGTTFAEAVRMFAAQSLLLNGMPLSLKAYPKKASSFGSLAKYADPEKLSQEKGAWTLAVEEKYGKTD